MIDANMWLKEHFAFAWCEKCGRDDRHHTAVAMLGARQQFALKCQLEPVYDAEGRLIVNPEGYEIAVDDMDDFTRAYVEAAVITEREDGAGLWEPSDIAPGTLGEMRVDCLRFMCSPAYVATVAAGNAARDCRYKDAPMEAYAGNDFWLTRNGHGAGFWDGSWTEPHGDALDAVAKPFGEYSLYRGDDGLIYGMKG